MLFYLAWRASWVCCVGPGAAGCALSSFMSGEHGALDSKAKLSRRDAADALRGDAAMLERAFGLLYGSWDDRASGLRH